MKDLSMHCRKLLIIGKKNGVLFTQRAIGDTNRRAKTGWAAFLFLLHAIFMIYLALSGCDYHTPTIAEVQYRLNLFNDLNSRKIYQKLSVFVVAQDLDGFDDLAKLYIIHDGQELYWTIDSKTWRNSNKAARSFIGNDSLVMPELGNFPDGEYRVILEDLAGDTTEKSFYLYAPPDQSSVPENLRFPGSYTKGQKVFITSKQEQVSVWLYKSVSAMAADETNSLLASLLVKNGERGISYQNIKQKVPALPPEFTYYVYTFDSNLNLGLITGPYYFTDIF